MGEIRATQVATHISCPPFGGQCGLFATANGDPPPTSCAHQAAYAGLSRHTGQVAVLERARPDSLWLRSASSTADRFSHSSTAGARSCPNTGHPGHRSHTSRSPRVTRSGQ